MVYHECDQPFLLHVVLLNKRTHTGTSVYYKCILKCFSLREIATDVDIKDHILFLFHLFSQYHTDI